MVVKISLKIDWESNLKIDKCFNKISLSDKTDYKWSQLYIWSIIDLKLRIGVKEWDTKIYSNMIWVSILFIFTFSWAVDKLAVTGYV